MPLNRTSLNRSEEIYEEIDAGDDLSTEMLFALTSERASEELGVDVDAGDVADAIDPERKR